MSGAIRNIVVVSDLHCGCRLGLCPGEGVDLDDGGRYEPSPIQRKVWGYWREFFDVWVPQVTRGEPYALVVNGDAIDGVHHRSVTQISHNIQDQIRIAQACLAPEVARAARYYHVRGTEAHVGPSAQHEERLAESLGAEPNESGQRATWELWARMGGHLIHFLHHVGTTGSSAYEATAVHKELTESFVEAGRWGDQPPDIIVRSHRHRSIESRIPSRAGYASAIVTPAWQLKTPFTFKIPGARLSQPQIGGILIRQGDEELHTRSRVWHIERPQEVVL